MDILTEASTRPSRCYVNGAFLRALARSCLLIACGFYLSGCATYSEVPLPDSAVPTGSLGTDKDGLAIGQSVRVTPNEGNRIEGIVEELTENELKIISSPNYGEEKVVFLWENISRIEAIQNSSYQGFLFVGSIFGIIAFSIAVGWIDTDWGLN